jgi:hypothetical protein
MIVGSAGKNAKAEQMNIVCPNCLRDLPVESFGPCYEDFWRIGTATTLASHRPLCDECFTSPDPRVEKQQAAYARFDPSI